MVIIIHAIAHHQSQSVHIYDKVETASDEFRLIATLEQETNKWVRNIGKDLIKQVPHANNGACHPGGRYWNSYTDTLMFYSSHFNTFQYQGLFRYKDTV